MDLDTDLAARLRHDLHERSAHLPTRGSGPAAARRAGLRRRRRRQLTSVTVTVSIVGAATASVLATRGPDDEGIVAGGAGFAEQAAASEPPFDWSVLDGQSEIGDLSVYEPATGVVTGADGTLYALSTAPGVTPIPPGTDWVPPDQSLYVSGDGTTWQERPLGDLRITALAERDGVLYAVGTAPSTAAVDGVAAVAAWSSDGGASWARATLPLDLDAGDDGSSTGITSTSVASGPAGVVAAVSTWTNLDIERHFPPGTEAPYGWATTEDGVDIYGPPPVPTAEQAQAQCPEAWTAEVLDVADLAATDRTPVPEAIPADSAEARAVSIEAARGTTKVVTCTAPDGRGEPIVVRDPGPSAVATHLAWAELGIDPALGAGLVRPTVRIFVAADGPRFEEVAVPFADNAHGAELLATADGYVAVVTQPSSIDPNAQPATTVTAWRSADGRTWNPLAAPALNELSWVVAAGIHDGALVVVDSQPGRVLRSADGVTWTSTSVADALADTVPAGADVQVSSAAIGPAGLALAVLTWPADDAAAGSPTERPTEPQSTFLVTSSDGQHFGAVRLADLVGATNGFVAWIDVSERVLVNVARFTDESGTAQRTLLVGTPPA
jgi:hypothetical protein